MHKRTSEFGAPGHADGECHPYREHVDELYLGFQNHQRLGKKTLGGF